MEGGGDDGPSSLHSHPTPTPRPRLWEELSGRISEATWARRTALSGARTAVSHGSCPGSRSDGDFIGYCSPTPPISKVLFFFFLILKSLCILTASGKLSLPLTALASQPPPGSRLPSETDAEIPRLPWDQPPDSQGPTSRHAQAKSCHRLCTVPPLEGKIDWTCKESILNFYITEPAREQNRFHSPCF